MLKPSERACGDTIALKGAVRGAQIPGTDTSTLQTAANKRKDFPPLIKLMDRERAGGGAERPPGRIRGPQRVIGRTQGHKSPADTTGALSELPGVRGVCLCVF